MFLDYDIVANRLSQDTGGELLHSRWKVHNLRKVWLMYSTGYWMVALEFRDKNTMSFEVFLWYILLIILFYYYFCKIVFWITNMQKF